MRRFILFLLVWQAVSQFTPTTLPPLSQDAGSNSIASGNPEFMLLEGKRSDPCNRWVSATNPDCETTPDSSVTVLIPSATSGEAQLGPRNIVDFLNQNYPLVIIGRRLLLTYPADGTTGVPTVNAGNPAPRIGLGLPGQGCSGGVVNTVPLSFIRSASAASLRTTYFPEENANLFQGQLETISFTPAKAWFGVDRELENAPRALCISASSGNPTNYIYTGFKIGVVWNCENLAGASTCGNLPPAMSPAVLADRTLLNGYQSLTNAQVQERSVRRVCCKNMNFTNTFPTDPVAAAARTAAGYPSRLNVGQCIFGTEQNALAPQSCCGSAAYKTADARCCNPLKQLTAFANIACPCTTLDQTCPAGESCCLFTKYDEFNGRITADPASQLKYNAYGDCFNNATHKCCDTGMRYDPGAQQCCPINGVQTLNVPCPCGSDANCPTGLRCCAQVNGTVNEIAPCSKYANFPSGVAPYQTQRCTGTCFDPTYQICCNGVQCIMAYEKCCNSTCCNRFTQTCQFGRRSAGSRYNFNEFNVLYHQCTTVQQLQPVKIAFPVVFPTFFLVISFFCTAIALIFANKASSRSYATIEKAMIYTAVLTNIVCVIFYFSLAWKYALTITVVQCFVILTASCRVKSLNVWCLILSVVLALYLVDPFHGNSYLTFASSRSVGVFPDRDSAGLIHVIGKMYKDPTHGNDSPALATLFCKVFYLTYFTRDNALRDLDRYDNAQISTFGYCDRAFILNLLVWCAVTYVLVLLQLLLVLVALLLRFTKSQVKVIVHEDE